MSPTYTNKQYDAKKGTHIIMENAQKPKKSFLGYAVIMAAITVVAKFLGLFRDILVANYYGMTMEAVAYDAASRLPVTVFDLVIGGVVTAAFIPVFNSIMVRRGKEDAMKFANSYVNFILIICIIIAAFGMLFAEALVSAIAPGITAEATVLAVKLTRIMFPMIIFTGLAFSFVGILQSMGEYNIPALISLVSNVIMVTYLFTLNTFFGAVGLGVSMIIGWAAQAFVQAPKAHSLGFRYRPTLKIFDRDLLRAAKNSIPILIGTWTVPVCSLINSRYASDIEEGRGMTAIGYANRLYIMLVGIFSFVATNLLFPFFSKAEAEGDRDGAMKMMRTSVKALVYIIAPITVGLILLAVPFTSLVYERGQFGPAETALTATALQGYAVGMIFMAANEVIVKALFAAEKPQVSMISSLVSMAFNIVIVIFLSERFGVGGIALATAISTILNLAINLAVSHKLYICRFNLRDIIDIAVSIISSAAMVPVIMLVSSHVSNSILAIALSVIAAAPVYFAVSLILRSEEAGFIVKGLLKKGKN